jgi:hypothetical protein
MASLQDSRRPSLFADPFIRRAIMSTDEFDHSTDIVMETHVIKETITDQTRPLIDDMRQVRAISLHFEHLPAVSGRQMALHFACNLHFCLVL